MDADPTCKDCNGWNAFMHALDAHYSVRAFKAAYDYLTKYDFSPGTGHHKSLFDRTTGSQPKGYTPLHFACSASYREFNNAEIVHLLLERRSDMEAREEKGKTPLLLAISAGLLPTVELLINRRADINTQSYGGQGVLQFCPSSQGSMKALLEKNGAPRSWGHSAGYRRQRSHPPSLAREMRYQALGHQASR